MYTYTLPPVYILYIPLHYQSLKWGATCKVPTYVQLRLPGLEAILIWYRPYQTNNYLTSRELADLNLAKLELNCYPITCEDTDNEFSIRWGLTVTLEGEKFQLRPSWPRWCASWKAGWLYCPPVGGSRLGNQINWQPLLILSTIWIINTHLYQACEWLC